MEELKEKLVAIAGLGREGQALLGYLKGKGIFPTIFDERTLDRFSEDDQQLLRESGVRFVLGADAFSELVNFNVIFRSPGVHRLHPRLLAAEEAGAHITSQTKWFFAHAPCHIIGVTGTKGKGTTCSLIYEMLNAAVKNREVHPGILFPDSAVYLTGNIGKTASLDILDNLKSTDIVVFELSSFQLQDLKQSPSIGVVLMITEEHLGHQGSVPQGFHASAEEYHGAKESIVAFQESGDISISNIDYPASKFIGQLGSGGKFFVSSNQEVEFGAFVKGERIIVRAVSEAVFNTANRKLRGVHNLENIAAASLAAYLAGAGSTAIQSCIDEFQGLEHRLELVSVHGGVAFYNDSIATTPESTMAAIASFSEPSIFILGGSDKGSDFKKLGSFIEGSNHIKHLIIVGQTTQRILEALRRAGFRRPVSTGAGNMAEIFAQISEVASSGDVVVLSPACASFGMFENYADRGNQFKEYAKIWRPDL